MSNVPKVRFKEFNGEWESKKLGDIALLTSSKRIFVNDYVNKGIPFYRGKEITELKKQKEPKDILYITREKYDDIKEKFGIPVEGDLLLTAVGTLGNTYVIQNDRPFYFKDGNLIWLKNITVNVYFLDFLLTSTRGQKKIIDSSIGSTQKALTIIELNKLKFLFPSLQEQEKIASFLSLIDDKINLQSEKVKYLKDYKKGLMQKIFSRELRFKDENGNDYPEWEGKRVYELGNIITGNTPSKDNLEYYDISNNEKFIWITPTDITEHKNIYEGATSLSKKGYEMTRKLPPNTVLVTCIASIGKNAILKVSGSCNQQINAIIVNSENNYEFVYYLIEHNTELLKKFAGITATPILNKTDFSNLEFLVPKIEEQEKISNILSKIDLKIEKEQERLYLFNEYKKGLLQQMFV